MSGFKFVCAKCVRHTDVVCMEPKYLDWCQECVAEDLDS